MYRFQEMFVCITIAEVASHLMGVINLCNLND